MSTRIGVISNRFSRRNRTRLEAISNFLDSVSCPHIVLDDLSRLEASLRQFAKEGVELLVINGGDGTVSAVMSLVWTTDCFATKPLLAVLPGGTSNTIAADVGLDGEPITALRHLFAARHGALTKKTRSLIRVDYDASKPPVCGMFFGTAAICDAILLRRRMFPQKWLPDSIAAALTLVYVLANVALRRATILSGQEIEITFDEARLDRQTYTIVVATTLEKIVLGAFPFWGDRKHKREGLIRMTTVAAPARGLVQNAYRLLYGKERDRLPSHTFASYSAESITLLMNCPFNLDGEFYQSPDSQATTLSLAGDVVFAQIPAKLSTNDPTNS